MSGGDQSKQSNDFLSGSRSPRPTSRRPGCARRCGEWQHRRPPTPWPATPSWGLALRSWCRWTCRCRHDALLLCSLRPSALVRPRPWLGLPDFQSSVFSSRHSTQKLTANLKRYSSKHHDVEVRTSMYWR